jgi:hypothetical protein
VPHCSICLSSEDLDLCCPNEACVMPYVCLPCRRLLSSPYYSCWLRPLSLDILQDAAAGIEPRRSYLVNTPPPIASHQRRLPSRGESSSPQQQREAAQLALPSSYREVTELSSAGPSRTYIEIRDDTVEPEEGSRQDRAISITDDGETPLATGSFDILPRALSFLPSN